MVIADTSVWIAHFRGDETELGNLLQDNRVMMHPHVIGELACGNFKNRQTVLSLLKALHFVSVVSDEELLSFIELHSLYGRGLGLIDMHLLASAKMSSVPLWTLDKVLIEVAKDLNVIYR